MKNYNKVLAGALAVIISAGATGSIAYAKNSGKTTDTADKADNEAKAENTSERKSNGEDAYKDETVYVRCNND